jgi:hypothetical protein
MLLLVGLSKVPHAIGLDMTRLLTMAWKPARPHAAAAAAAAAANARPSVLTVLGGLLDVAHGSAGLK